MERFCQTFGIETRPGLSSKKGIILRLSVSLEIVSQVEEFLRVGKRDLSNHSIIVTELDEDAKNDSSSMWKAIKQTLSLDHMDTNAIFSNGKPHISFVDIAEHLNHFSNIGRYLAKAFRNA
ncbi:hypothetical protein P5673_012512, partial [Acropora cervicornis]